MATRGGHGNTARWRGTLNGMSKSGVGIGDWDEALCRLEDVLATYDFDRALPNLDEILAAARIDLAYVQADERALKVLSEAIVARPLSTSDQVGGLALEVELLTLEVRVLTERLAVPTTDPVDAERVTSRLARIRQRLDEVRSKL